MSYIIVAGGISVNDPQNHDQFPYNFINPAVAKVKALKAVGVSGADIAVALFAPSYEERVRKQRVEHKRVTPSYLPCFWEWACKQGYEERLKNPAHFTRIAADSTSKAGAAYFELRKAADLTDLLSKLATIHAIYYFGHSSAEEMFLEYSVSIASSGTVAWGKSAAAAIDKSSFAAGAKFVSYGCYQGDTGGLAQQLSDPSLWGIRCIGSKGKTDFEPIGQLKSFPTSAGGWVSYTAGRLDPGAVDIATIV